MNFEELMKDAEFAAKMEAAESAAEIVELLKTKGIETTEEEIEKAYNKASQAGDELNEADLENVAGGSMTHALMVLLGLGYWLWRNGKRVFVKRR